MTDGDQCSSLRCRRDLIDEIERRSGVKWGNLSPDERVAWINEVLS